MTLSDLVTEALSKSKGDNYAAAKLLEKWCKTRKGVLEALIPDRLIRRACWDLVRYQGRKERREIWMAPRYSKSSRGKRVMAEAKTRLMDFRLPIPGGKMLRYATPEDLDLAIKHYRTQIKAETERVEWLERIRPRVTRTVGEDLTEEDLQKLRG